MKPDAYLKKILEQQTFENDDQELEDLRKHRKDIDKLLRAHFSKSTTSIRWAGSMAKGTMIRESYDGDMTCYFPHDETEAGTTLAEIFENTEKGLLKSYNVERKASALRVRDRESWTTDLHIDVVPGRFTTDEDTDVFLHRTTGDKERLKTNLQTHIDHIRQSGLQDAIRLLKLWKTQNGIDTAKTFVLELLVVKLLEDKTSSTISEQIEHVLTEFRDSPNDLSVEDPANSNNDLKPILDQCRSMLSTAATNTLWQIENSGWESVFGELEEESDDVKVAGLTSAAVHVGSRTKPWLPEK